MREAGRRAGWRKGGRQAEREEGGESEEGESVILVGVGGPLEENADEEKALPWMEGPPPGHPPPPHHATALPRQPLGTGADERWGDLMRRPRCWGRELTGMKKYEKKQKKSPQDPRSRAGVHKPHKDKDRGKPREKRKRPTETRKQTTETSKGLQRQGSCGAESPWDDGERPMGTESPPQGWGAVHGDERRQWTRGAHRNGSKKAPHREGRQAEERARRSQKGQEAHRHQGSYKDKDADTRGPLRQEQPAHREKGEAPRNRNSPHRGEGW